MNEQRRVETVEEFKLRIAAIMSGNPEQIKVHHDRTRCWSVAKSGRPIASQNVDLDASCCQFQFIPFTSECSNSMRRAS